MHKIKLVSIGGCVGYDILMTGVTWRHKFYMMSRYMGSVSRGYFKSGKIAERLQEEMPLLMNSVPNHMKAKVDRQLKAICKTDTIQSIIKRQIPNTIIIVDPGYELSDYYDDGDESFDIFPEYEEISNYFPDWFQIKVAKNRFKFDVASPRVEAQRDETYLDFFKLISNQKCLACFIDNASTERSYIKKLNSVSVTISAFNSRVPFLTSNADGDQMMLNFNYARRLIDRLYRRIKTNKEKYYIGENTDKAVWFDIDKEHCFADPDHRWGYHPTHLHYLCREIYVNKLHDTLVNLYNRNVKIVQTN
jgi:hypothetical protein